MVRIILGVIVGYVAYSIALFVLFSGLYMILGASGSFLEGNYDLRLRWILPSIVVFFVGGAVASLVCGLIAKNAKSGLYMGGVILVLGLLIAFMQIAQDPGVTVRGAEEVGIFDAMNKAHGPIWTHFVNAIAGFVGAFTGGNLFSKNT